MEYIRVRWHHSNPDEPAWLYSELDDERREVRKVYIWSNGRRGYASKDVEVGDVFLGLMLIPSLCNIATDSQFEPDIITREEFDAVWNETLRQKP